jgi:hypothetical protein
LKKTKKKHRRRRRRRRRRKKKDAVFWWQAWLSFFLTILGVSASLWRENGHHVAGQGDDNACVIQQSFEDKKVTLAENQGSGRLEFKVQKQSLSRKCFWVQVVVFSG